MELPGFYVMSYHSCYHQPSVFTSFTAKGLISTGMEKKGVQKVKHCLYIVSDEFLFNIYSKYHTNNLNV